MPASVLCPSAEIASGTEDDRGDRVNGGLARSRRAIDECMWSPHQGAANRRHREPAKLKSGVLRVAPVVQPKVIPEALSVEWRTIVQHDRLEAEVKELPAFDWLPEIDDDPAVFEPDAATANAERIERPRLAAGLDQRLAGCLEVGGALPSRKPMSPESRLGQPEQILLREKLLRRRQNDDLPNGV